MIGTCPYCHSTLPAHGQCCRVPGDLDRFVRVYQRLNDDHRNEFLRDNLARYLDAFGRLDLECLDGQPERGGAKSATIAA